MGKIEEIFLYAPLYVILAYVTCVILPIIAIVAICILWLLITYGLTALFFMWIAGLIVIAWHVRKNT